MFRSVWVLVLRIAICDLPEREIYAQVEPDKADMAAGMIKSSQGAKVSHLFVVVIEFTTPRKALESEAER